MPTTSGSAPSIAATAALTAAESSTTALQRSSSHARERVLTTLAGLHAVIVPRGGRAPHAELLVKDRCDHDVGDDKSKTASVDDRGVDSARTRRSRCSRRLGTRAEALRYHPPRGALVQEADDGSPPRSNGKGAGSHMASMLLAPLSPSSTTKCVPRAHRMASTVKRRRRRPTTSSRASLT